MIITKTFSPVVQERSKQDFSEGHSKWKQTKPSKERKVCKQKWNLWGSYVISFTAPASKLLMALTSITYDRPLLLGLLNFSSVVQKTTKQSGVDSFSGQRLTYGSYLSSQGEMWKSEKGNAGGLTSYALPESRGTDCLWRNQSINSSAFVKHCNAPCVRKFRLFTSQLLSSIHSLLDW